MDLRKNHDIVPQDGIVFLSYGGVLSQALIAGMTEALEKEAEHNQLQKNISYKIFTIFIELSQNMMKYSVSKGENLKRSKGVIFVGRSTDEHYYVHSHNRINNADISKLKTALEGITKLNPEELKTQYREQRRKGNNKHEQGAGIGFYEIAKRSSRINFDFTPADETGSFFNIHAIISNN